MSFRSRLRLFVAIIVVLPVADMAATIFPRTEDSERGKVDAGLATALDVATSLYADGRAEARGHLRRLARDERLQAALRDGEDRAATRRLRALVASSEAIVSATLIDTSRRRLSTGSSIGVAAAVARLASPDGEDLGTIAVSVTDPGELAATLAGRTDLEAVVLRDGRAVGRSAASVPSVPEGSADVEFRGRASRSRRAAVGSPAGRAEEIGVVAPIGGGATGMTDDRLMLGAILLVFLAVALGLSALVSRGLPAQIEEFLGAARRLARGRFDQPVSTTGADAFAQLGHEFNSMSD